MKLKAQKGKNILNPKRLKNIFLTIAAVFVVWSLTVTFLFVLIKHVFVEEQQEALRQEAKIILDELQFPVGVNLQEKLISENPDVDTYFEEHVAMQSSSVGAHTSFIGRIIGKLALINAFQNLASLSSRVLIIEAGERKEQVSEHFGKILGWSDEERDEFLSIIEKSAPELIEGKFYPGGYTVAKGATPEEVAALIVDRFTAQVLSRYGEEVAAAVPLNDTLIIASLIEREAYDFDDMRHISGVIWNRLFSGMPLQLDATLQYAKGSDPNQPWWPRVLPSDKYIVSEHNTYKNEGLPPTPIANPSLEAILAALNPRETDCMYYFHDRKAGFHCSATYEEHVALLKKHYGRGR